MKKKTIMVTIRLKKEVAIAYKQCLIYMHKSISEDLSEHIERQAQYYQYIDDYEPMKTTSKEYIKINFRIDDEIYTQYKVRLVGNATNTTADCTRHILKTIYDYKNSKGENL